MAGVSGVVSLSERGGLDEKDYYERLELVKKDHDDVHFRVSVGSGDDLLEVQISCYHVESEETGRAFHCSIEARLDRKQLAKLHGYIGYLLEHEWLAGAG